MMTRLALLAGLALALSAAPADAQSVPRWAAPAEVTAPPDPGGAPTLPGGGTPPAQSVPVDGGLGLLALAGGTYAVRRLRRGSGPAAPSR